MELRPGIGLITLDPKLSSTIIGAEAFADEAVMAEVAARPQFEKTPAGRLPPRGCCDFLGLVTLQI